MKIEIKVFAGGTHIATLRRRADRVASTITAWQEQMDLGRPLTFVQEPVKP